MPPHRHLIIPDDAEPRDYTSDGLGIDFAFPEADITRAMHKTGLLDGVADVVTSFDALEHLLPEDVDAVLAEMQRVGRPRAHFVFSICTRPSRTTVAGEGLHPTVRPLAWWLLAATIIAAYGQEVLDWINQHKQRLLDKWNAMGKAAGCAAAEAAYNSFCKPLAGCGKWSKTPPKNCNLLLNAATSAVICLAAREFIAKMGCPSGHKTPESLIETITNTIAKCYSMYIDCLNKAKTNTPPGPTACGQPKEDPTLVWV